MSFSHEIGARTLWGEARGEPIEGQIACAWTMTNRVRDPRWGGMYATVCTWPAQFSCWNPGDPNRIKMLSLPDNDPLLLKLAAIIEDAANGKSVDPTGGAKFYFADSIPPPAWAANMIFCGKFGHHLFYREKPAGGPDVS